METHPGSTTEAAPRRDLRKNIASALSRLATLQPRQSAVVIPGRGGRGVRASWSYAELDTRSAALASGLESVGVGRGSRCVVMVPPGLEFFSLIFALLRSGIVPVVVDPGMGFRNLRQCLCEARPDAFIGIPRANAARAVLGWARETVRTVVTTGPFRLGRGFTLRDLESRGLSAPAKEPVALGDQETAAILFTSGSTGPPRGAVYTHSNFAAQVEALRTTYSIEPGEIDLCTFPLFALFAPALGMTAVVPDMDPTHPARADPERLLRTAREFGATNFFGSPALIRNVGHYASRTGFRVPTLRRAISAGAPVPAKAIEKFLAVLPPGAQVFTPYGATEALPVSSIGSDEILGVTRRLTDEGKGICVGRAAGEVEIEIIRVSDEPIPTWSPALRVRDGEIGEIAVRGDIVTTEYFGRPEATRLAKISTGTGILHRMGDLGWRDGQGRIWFCGRKSHRVHTPEGVLYTIACEAVFNTLAGISRTALVGVQRTGSVEPALVVELDSHIRSNQRARLARELCEIAQRYPHTQTIKKVLFHPRFPVDIRHNAKIAREKLARWAAKRLP